MSQEDEKTQQPGENQDQNQFKTEEDMSDDERKQLAEDEDFILNFKQEDYSDPAKIEQLEKALVNAKTTIHQKRHYRTKYNEEVEKGKGQQPPKTEEKPGDKPEEKKPNEHKGEEVTNVEIIDFRQDHPELSREVAKEVLQFAKFKGISIDKALESPVIKSLIKTETKKEDIEDAGVKPQPGGGSNLADKDWSNASEKDIQDQRAKMGMEY